MPWRPISTQNVLGMLTASENAMLTNSSGMVSKLGERLNDSILAFDSALIAVGNNVAAPPNMVDSLRQDVMSHCLWRWLLNFPQLKAFATDARREAFKDAESKLQAISKRQYGAVEDPSGYDKSQGNWGSDNRILMRMYPTPPPQWQWTQTGNPQPQSANPNAVPIVPADTIPQPPRNISAVPIPGYPTQLYVSWVPPIGGATFTLYRSTTSGTEMQNAPIATNLTVAYWYDTGLVEGTAYYYVATSANEVGISLPSSETTGTPQVWPPVINNGP